MFHYRRLPSERTVVTDRITGRPLTRLTSGRGRAYPVYFTTNGWTRDGRHLLIVADRDFGEQLYAVELASGDLLQLTDLAPPDPLHATAGLGLASLSPVADEMALWTDPGLVVQNLTTGQSELLFPSPPGKQRHGTSWTADGTHVLTSISASKDLTGGGTSFDGVRAMIAEKPHSQVLAVPRSGGEPLVVHEEDWLITHVNASPTVPGLLTFCHEGPWLEIDQRIWGLRIGGDGPWPIVPRDPDWGVGHEFWCCDGETIGYHARYREGTWRHAAGFARATGGEVWQAELAVPTQHAHAATTTRMLFDGTREAGEYLMIADRQGDAWGAQRVLAAHDCSRANHRTHVHARIRGDGRQVVFCSDRRGYGDVYVVDVPDDLSELPEWPGKPFRYYWQ